MAYLLQQLLNALPMASLYACLAFGYSLAFGVTKRPDITFGALVAFAGQICLLFTDFGWNGLYLVLPAALGLGLAAGFAYALLAGYWNARTVMLPLHKRSPNAVIVASLGVVLLLSEGARNALDTRSLWLPPLGQHFVTILRTEDTALGLTRLQMLHSALMLAVVAGGALLLTFSRAGRLWQAVCQDPLAARLVGINADKVFVLSLTAAASVAAAGGLSATVLYGTMDFGAGLMLGLKVVLIAAVGGYSRPLHSALGAAAIAFAEQLWGAYGPMIWRDAVIISALIWLLVVSRRERIIP
ncbi:branched-chain amino acid ABC transporter permease [Rhizobium rosettiformans]|uniref:branched-chain amino acid ABC transporter permease n=1 Tax=Rhizobium rosettiformans TaxID=1368430 RepID=UPI002858B963|nr:branched-chain amino acid ABC transporter permease [Rhizobium rosettiformans]MDR7027040.1 branched-chain amino acid transport system permease protein [Rhizobium rosettiformans]MDR7065161.1 branched-chain amino acid transport system permease protein [Rhizobium rosettiformans]